MRTVMIGGLCLVLVISSASCIAPVALGAAGAAAGAGAQAGWWFGKKSKDAAHEKEQQQKEATHEKGSAQ